MANSIDPFVVKKDVIAEADGGFSPGARLPYSHVVRRSEGLTVFSCYSPGLVFTRRGAEWTVKRRGARKVLVKTKLRNGKDVELTDVTKDDLLQYLRRYDGQKLPSTRDMAEALKISRPTIYRRLVKLESEGKIRLEGKYFRKIFIL